MVNKSKGKTKGGKYTKKKDGKYRSSSGSTPGKDNLKRQGQGADSRNKVKGGGGGVKRKKSPTLKADSKKQIKTAKKMNQAKGRKYKKR